MAEDPEGDHSMRDSDESARVSPNVKDILGAEDAVQEVVGINPAAPHQQQTQLQHQQSMPASVQENNSFDESQQMSEGEMRAFMFGSFPPESEPQQFPDSQQARTHSIHSYAPLSNSQLVLDMSEQQQQIMSQPAEDHHVPSNLPVSPGSHTAPTGVGPLGGSARPVPPIFVQAGTPSAATAAASEASHPITAGISSTGTSLAAASPAGPLPVTAAAALPPPSVTAPAGAAGPTKLPSSNTWSDDDDDGMDLDEELRQYMALKESMADEESGPTSPRPQPAPALPPPLDAHPSLQAPHREAAAAAPQPHRPASSSHAAAAHTPAVHHPTASLPDDDMDEDGDRELEELMDLQREHAEAQQQQARGHNHTPSASTASLRPTVELPDPKRPKLAPVHQTHPAVGGKKGVHKEGYESQFMGEDNGGVEKQAPAAAAAAAAAQQDLRLRSGAAAVAAAAAAALQASFQAPCRMAGDIRGACISVTRGSGERVYCALASARDTASSALRAVAGGSSTAGALPTGRKQGQLLGRSVAEMMQVRGSHTACENVHAQSLTAVCCLKSQKSLQESNGSTDFSISGIVLLMSSGTICPGLGACSD